MLFEKTEVLPKAVFIATFIVAFINIISIFFPALLINITYPSIDQINSFEVGFWALLVLFSNLTVLYLSIIFYRTRPKFLEKILNFIKNFEISKRTTLISIVVILFIYISFSFNDLFINEADDWLDFERIDIVLQDFPFGEEGGKAIRNLFVKNFFLSSSIYLFDNVKIIPFIASNAILILTYLFTSKLANRRFAGIIALLVLIQSPIFRMYDTTATYSNFWTLFYLLSLYLIYKVWYTSPISFILSIFCKPLTFVFVPLSLYLILRSNLVRKRKLVLLITYISLVILVISILNFYQSGMIVNDIEFDLQEFVVGLSTWPYQLRYEAFLFSLILPMTIGLFVISRKINRNAEIVLVLIMGTILSFPILNGLTGYDIHPYRHMPFIVFFSVGIGMIFSSRLWKKH